MKHLRKYNEELRPDVYRRAGEILKDKGKPERGSKLIDYYDEMTSGFFNIITDDSAKSVVTRPKSEFYYSYINPISRNSNIIDMNIRTVDELIECWTEGSRYLSFTISVKFLLKDDPRYPNYNRGSSGMSFEFILNDWQHGKEEFQADWDLDKLDIYDFYKDSKESSNIDIYLKKGIYVDSEYRSGKWKKETRTDNRNILFSDRKSAIKFKNILPDLVTEHKDKIMDIFSIIGTDVDEWDNLIKSIKGIRINNLYVDTKDGFKEILPYPLN